MSISIVRHSEPSHLDEAPFGCLCYVNHTKDFDLYVQVSKKDLPNWEFMGNFSNDTQSDYIDALIHKRLYLTSP